MDIALVNLWKFLDAEGACSYEYYNHTAYDENSPMLDLVHDLEDHDKPKDDDAPPYEDDTRKRIGNADADYERGMENEPPRPRLRRAHGDF